jgi:hypothetical protein
LKFGLKPFIDAFGVKDMLTDRDLAYWDALLEFFEADHTLCLFELVNALIIRALSDQSYQNIDSHLLALHLPPYLLPHLYLVILDLLL